MMVFSRTKQALSDVFEKFKGFVLSLVKVPYSIGQDIMEVEDKVADYIKNTFDDIRDTMRPAENYLKLLGNKAKDAVDTYLAYGSEMSAISGVVSGLSSVLGTGFDPVAQNKNKNVDLQTGLKSIEYGVYYRPDPDRKITGNDVISALVSIGFSQDPYNQNILTFYDQDRQIFLSADVKSDGSFLIQARKFI